MKFKQSLNVKILPGFFGSTAGSDYMGHAVDILQDPLML